MGLVSKGDFWALSVDTLVFPRSTGYMLTSFRVFLIGNYVINSSKMICNYSSYITTLNCPISVDYDLELCIAITMLLRAMSFFYPNNISTLAMIFSVINSNCLAQY